CDGLGDCLPECPTGAITLEEKETVPFDKAAVERHMAQNKAKEETMACGCPSTHAKTFERKANPQPERPVPQEAVVSELRQWPVQIKLVAPNAPFLQGADLLVAATCSAFSNANVHQQFMKNKVTLIGCPKLDMVDYSEKLAEILEANDINSITVLRMSVPCCGGLTEAVKQALIKSGKMIPWSIAMLDTNGEVLA
ncbi:MAG: ferredoxin, partial [Eubacteriales bacterium]